jgi:hypothetical protein
MVNRSRKAQRKQQRKSQKKQQRRSQRGGGSCSAMPLNRELFMTSQRGGMAPFASLDNGYLIDQAARVQAETYPLDQALSELPSVISRAQHGGRRRSRSQRRNRSSRRQSRKQSQSRKQRSQRRSQKGGMYPIDADTMLLPRGVNAGFNSQFANEAQVNNLYNEYSGPQGPHTRV